MPTNSTKSEIWNTHKNQMNPILNEKNCLLKTFLFSNDQKRNRGARKMNLLTILVEL